MQKIKTAPAGACHGRWALGANRAASAYRMPQNGPQRCHNHPVSGKLLFLPVSWPQNATPPRQRHSMAGFTYCPVVSFHVYIVLLETRDDGTNHGRSKPSKQIVDEFQHLKFILAFAVHSNVTNRKSAVLAAIGKMPLPQRPPFISLK